MPDFVGRRKWFFLLSALVLVPGIISIAAFRFNAGIEFSPGSTMTLVFEQAVTSGEVQDGLASAGHSEAVARHTPQNAVVFQAAPLDEEAVRKLDEGLAPQFGVVRIARFPITPPEVPEGEPAPQPVETVALLFGPREVDPERVGDVLDTLGYTDADPEGRRLDSYLVRTAEIDPEEKDQIKTVLEGTLGSADIIDFNFVSPEVASDRLKYTIIAVIVAAVGILLFITWAFRKMENPIRLGVCAIVALVHDALVVAGIFSLFRIEVESMFIIAVLTVIGYSVNDTIVVFDRIRENTARGIGADFPETVNMSLVQTLGRSLNTAITTLFVLLALYLIGGATISHFVLALIIGIIAGTYSSIGIASQLLVTWERGDIGRLLRRLPLPRPAFRRAG